MTAPNILRSSVSPATDADLPPLHRILTPDEFHAAQTLSPSALQTPGLFPALPKAPADATATALPRQLAAQPSGTVGPALPGNEPIHSLAHDAVAAWGDIGDAGVRAFVHDVFHDPARAALNLTPEGMTMLAGKDAIDQGAKGNVSGAVGTALSAAPFLAAPLSGEAKGYIGRIAQAWRDMHAGSAEMGEAKGILRATTGSMAANYEQAAFKLDQFRRLINPLSDEQKLAFIHAIETGQPSPEALASVGADVKGYGARQPQPSGVSESLPTSIADVGKESFPSSDAARASARAEPADMAIPADITPHRARMAQVNGAMAARGGDPITANPYKPDSPLFSAWADGHSGVPPEDFGAENVLKEQAGKLSLSDMKQIQADLGEERQIAATSRARDATPAASAINPAFADLAATIRSTLDGARDQIRALGTGKLDNFIEDYFPHIWSDPERATDVFKQIGGKGPLEGPASFLKERSIPTIQEGIEQGLTPVSTNPIDLTKLKLREMQRYLMAHQSMSNLSDAGLTKYVPSGGEIPDGYSRINDKIATVFGPRQGAVTLPEGATVGGEPMSPSDVSVPGRRVMGEYWAPKPVADLLNNYLSPGLPATLQSWFPGPLGKGAAMTYEAYRGLGNTLNQFQLGLSAFHLGFTSLDATTSRTALGLEYLAQGHPWEAAKRIVTAPAASLPGVIQGTAGDLSNFAFGTDFKFGLGAKIRDAYLNPEKASPEMAQLANAVQEAGGRIRQDSFYQTHAIDNFLDALHARRPAGTVGYMLPALLELAAKPIMEHIVPLQKLQVFGELAQKAIKDLPPDASLAERRAAYSSAWDSADNRMGQLVYDNLFWNKTFKDLAMASTRSVGWNLGTIRELGGGLVDAGGYAKDLLTPNVKAQLTHRTAYVAALPLTVGLLGAAYQYLKTGQGPQELKDYFFPKTGDTDVDGTPDRVQLPSYMKDLFAYAGDPVATVEHKMSPLPSLIGEMLNNKDYYGDEIRNPHDPLVKKFQQEAEYVGQTFLPFGIRNMMEQNARGDRPSTGVESLFGVTPAKREDVRTPAENLMHDYAKEHGSGGATPEMVQARQERSAVLAGLRGSKGVDLEKAVSTALQSGNLTPPSLARLLKRAGMTPDQERFKALPLDEALNVFKVAQPREQAKFAEALAKKIEKASRN